MPVRVRPCHLLYRFPLSALTAHADDFDYFEQHVRPILVERCYSCHGDGLSSVQGEFFIVSREGALKGGKSGKPGIVPGDPEASRIVEAIRYQNPDLQMPPKKKLEDAEIDVIVNWIAMGAPDPRTDSAPKPTAPGAKLWALQPVTDPVVPEVQNKAWVKSPVDAFVLSRLEEKGLSPAPPVDKRALIRRATYDLTGLPPTPDEVDAFLADGSPDAFATVIDRLLASPHYGERWGRHWLDVARYADTKGYVYSDREIWRFMHSYVYRDWVVKALNEDMPYDRFLLLQFAADEVATDADHEDLAAMGFLTLGRRFLGVAHDIIDDRIDTVMRGTQALTVACARCHDLSFHPIPTTDYYSLYGIFAGSTERTWQLTANPEPTEAYKAYQQVASDARVQEYQKKFDEKASELSTRLRETGEGLSRRSAERRQVAHRRFLRDSSGQRTESNHRAVVAKPFAKPNRRILKWFNGLESGSARETFAKRKSDTCQSWPRRRRSRRKEKPRPRSTRASPTSSASIPPTP